jgi:hypothetical protein
MEADEGQHAEGSHVRGASQHGGCGREPGHTERKGRPAEPRAVARSAERSAVPSAMSPSGRMTRPV